jgi:glycosyl transferase family 25
LQAFYINLAHRSDRRASMEAQFSRLGIQAQRVEAFLASNLPPELVAHHAKLGAHSRLSSSEFSVGVSHRQACHQFLNSGDHHALILEDDAVLAPRLPGFLEAFRRDPQEIDLLRLETFNSPSQILTRPDATLGGFALHTMHGWAWGSAAYIISRVAAQAVVNNPRALDNIIDRVLYRPHRTVLGSIKRRQLVPALAIQADRVAGAIWGADSDLVAGRTEGLSAPKPSLAKAIAKFIDSEISIALPSALHRMAGLSQKRIIPFAGIQS